MPGMRSLSDLERVAPALLPHRSATVRPIDWAALHTELGVAFPADYRDYVSRYPGVTFDDFMHVVTPDPGGESDYLAGVSETLEMMESFAEDDMTEGYRFHPDEGGLIPWGESNQGDIFFWRKNGPDPDRWPAVVYTANSDWWEHEGGMLSLLVGFIDGTVEHLGLPPQPGPNPTVTE
jgi:SMI1/KNR4 family protein SUKH-1